VKEKTVTPAKLAEPAVGCLYVVATPIGNLEDISLRALRILKECDAIACEDTRQTVKLLTHFDIQKRLVSYHEHNEITRAAEMIIELEQGAKVALVTDAGDAIDFGPGAAAGEFVFAAWNSGGADSGGVRVCDGAGGVGDGDRGVYVCRVFAVAADGAAEAVAGTGGGTADLGVVRGAAPAAGYIGRRAGNFGKQAGSGGTRIDEIVRGIRARAFGGFAGGGKEEGAARGKLLC
jgi:hypothetical protein